MTRSSVLVAVLVLFAAFAMVSLVGGASYLEATLPGGLPLGNLLVSLGFCAMAGAAVLLGKRGPVLRVASLLALAGAVLWLPVSVVLAGNLQLNFSNGRDAAWLGFSAGVFASVVLALAWGLGAAVLARIRGRV